MRVSITNDETIRDGEYGHPFDVKILTTNGKEYIFCGEDCWEEGLEGFLLDKDNIYYCNFNGKITSPRNLAAALYFASVWESWPEFAFPTFDFLCGIISIEEYVDTMKKRETQIKEEIQVLASGKYTREQLMTVLEPYLPEYSEKSIAPYIAFFAEVGSLEEIESIQITIY